VPTETEPPQRNLKQVRTLLWILVALTLAGAAALYLVPRLTQQESAVLATKTTPASYGPFTLTDADGKTFSSASLAGKPYALFFGFTNCGDVCPTTLARLVKLREQAGAANKLAILFITTDPERDGPKEVGQYAKAFHSPIIGLTGSRAQIDQVTRQFGIVAEKMPMAGHSGHDMDYQMNHTATVLLFGADGKLAGTIATDEADGAALDKLRRITT
jgi:protein SCO1/2